MAEMEIEMIHECMSVITDPVTVMAKRTEAGFNFAQGAVNMGPVAFQAYGVCELLLNALNDKGKASEIRLGSLIAVKALADLALSPVTGEEKGTQKKSSRWLEAYLVTVYLPAVLRMYNDRSQLVKSATDAALDSLLSPDGEGGLNKLGASQCLQAIFQGMQDPKWQVKVGAIEALVRLSKSHKEQVGKCLPDVILQLIECVFDTKKEVKQTALKGFTDICNAVIVNPDIISVIPALVSAYASNNAIETGKALDKLCATTFVNAVDSSTLAVVVPILIRGFRERKTASRRICAIITENMCKLVVDPRDAATFFPMLEPLLQDAVDEVNDTDIKETCVKAYQTIMKLMKDIHAETSGKIITAEIVRVTLVPRLRNLIAASKSAIVEDSELDTLTPLLAYVSGMCGFLVDRLNFDPIEWKNCMAPYLVCLFGDEEGMAANFSGASPVSLLSCFQQEVAGVAGVQVVSEATLDNGADTVCDIEFSLAYGGKILLHNARLNLLKAHRYGLVGKNGVGKTTLMRNIANGAVDGLPTDLLTVFVEHDIVGTDIDLNVLDWLSNQLLAYNVPVERTLATLRDVAFTEEMINGPIASLSGGWRMKLALARAMLMNADILLMDEPTNHLDELSVKWLTNYLQSLTTCCCLIVSHSTAFLDDVCTDILHYETQKLVRYRGNLSAFVKKRPEAKSYYELCSDTLKFTFPVPGRLDGIKSRTQNIIKMEGVSFTYPNAAQPQLEHVNVKITLGSRVAVIGPNGAGKSTLIKMMVGETVPTQGSNWKHHNLRVAYVAQHAFHHVEQHLDSSPVEYIRWRFQEGVDKEALEKEAVQLTEEEQERMNSGSWGSVESLVGRRTKNRKLEYEVKWVGRPEKENAWLLKTKLEAMGYGQLIKQTDEKLAAVDAGLDLRPVTTREIQGHLNDFGLEQEFGTYGKIRGLSGGQKVKLVIAAAMWNKPHLMIMDEPTNYLDREALGALATALKEFGGGVIMISHDREFFSAICTEHWVVANRRVHIEGDSEMENDDLMRENKKDKENNSMPEEKTIESVAANTNQDILVAEKAETHDFWGKPLSKAEIRRREKELKKKQKEAAKGSLAK